MVGLLKQPEAQYSKRVSGLAAPVLSKDCLSVGSPDLVPRPVLDGRLRAGPEVLQPAEEDHDPRGQRGHEHSRHRRRTLH